MMVRILKKLTNKYNIINTVDQESDLIIKGEIDVNFKDGKDNLGEITTCYSLLWQHKHY